MDYKTIELLIKREASASVGNSTLRGQGAKGVVDSSRKALARIKIDKYSVVSTQDEFLRILEGDTQELMKSLPTGAQNWGAARKVLNIFLRSLVYNKHICKALKFNHIEKWLEIPLDSHVAKGLSSTTLGSDLPRWHSIKHLNKNDSDRYQTIANKIAQKLGINRVDLDIYLWRQVGIKYLKDI